MKKYEIWTVSFDVRLGNRKGEEWTEYELVREFCSQDSDPQRRTSYTTEEEAREAFAAHWADYGSTRLFSAFSGGYYLSCKIAYLEPAEYDEDGDYIEGGDWVMESVEPYVPALRDVDLGRASNSLLARLVNEAEQWDEDGVEDVLEELADRAGRNLEDYTDDEWNLDAPRLAEDIQKYLDVKIEV